MDSMADNATRIVQVFLSSHTSTLSVCEVSVNKGTKQLLCTCPGFDSRGNCKHVKFVKDKIDVNSGTYPLQISSGVSDEELNGVYDDSDAFRDLVIKYGKIEVL